jgi:hypothetical protein
MFSSVISALNRAPVILESVWFPKLSAGALGLTQQLPSFIFARLTTPTANRRATH